MKRWNVNKAILAGSVGLALLISGCGSSSPNVITVTVTPSAATAIAGQVTNFTAAVGGSTTLTVNWSCTYVYTPLPTTSTPNPSPTSATNCTSGQTVNGGSIGTWTTSNTNGSNVLTYTAPSLTNFPNPIPTITFTAAATADTKKTGTAAVSLDTGIRASITPTTVTVAVGITPPQKVAFSVSLLNTNNSTAKYSLVQPNTASSNINDQTANPLSDTCTVSSPTSTNPGCGSIDANGVYTAPMALPTDTVPSGSTSTAPTTVYVVGWSSSDTVHYSVATITLVSATTNPSTFTGIYPTTVAAGGFLQDIFLNAKNLLNTTQINFVPPTAQANLTASSGAPLSATQVFTIPISAEYCTPSASGVTPVVTCDASIMTRVRLLAAQLAQPETNANQPAWILIPNLPGTTTTQEPCVNLTTSVADTTAIACPLQIVNAGPALVSAVPYSIPQNANLGSTAVGALGGYYGATGALVNLSYAGQGLSVDSTLSSSAGPRNVFGTLSNNQMPSPGLYEVGISSSISQGTPPLFPTAFTNAAIQPDFAVTPTPTSVPLNSYTSNGNTSTNLAPSAIALDSLKGFAILTEQATGTLQFISLAGAVPAQMGNPVPVGSKASVPTDIALDTSIDATNNGSDLAVVVSSGDNMLYLFSVTPNGTFTPEGSVSVNLQTLLQQPGVTGLPAPVSFGVDPSTHLGVVAYQNTNIGFIVDVNPNLDGSDARKCFLGSSVKAPCVVAPVAINTGTWPKVVMQPNVPLAYVTPGGGYGTTSVVNLLQTGTSVSILPYSSTGTSGAVRTAGVTMIHTQTPHGINPVLGGTVIISGITTKTANSNFNGTFNVIAGSVTDPFTFSYAQTGQPDDTESNTSSALGTVTYGSPYYSFSTTANASGGAINSITRTFAYADFNSASAQIGFISTLDQTLTSLTLTAGSCNGCNPTPSGTPEIGFRSVAFDPFTNVLVAFNPSDNSSTNFAGNEISLINPGGPAASGGTNFPYRIIAAINTGQTGTGSYTPAGQSTAVTVYGPMTYDPKSKFVLAANAGSNTLTYMNLDVDPNNRFQRAHIQDLQLPPSSCPSLSNPTTCYAVPVAQPTLGSLAPAKTCSFTDPAAPCMPQAVQQGKTATLRILGQGFSTLINPVVRLDGMTSITPPGQTTPITFPPTPVSDSEIDVTIPAAALFTPHDFSVDVQGQGVTATNAIDLHVVGLLDMSSACQPTSSFPQGPEGVAVDSSLHIALVTNYACNSVSIIAINPNGYVASDGSVKPFGTILSTIGVGNQPLGIAAIPRLGYAVVANNGDTPFGTASIIDYSDKISSSNGTPENPKIVTWNVTSGTTTTPTNKVNVGLAPLGVAIDQDHALALVANNGSSTLSGIDLTVLLPGAVTVTTPEATTIALSGPPTALAIDPNRAIAVVTNLQNSGTTSVTGGLDVVNLASNPPVKSSTSSVSSLTASPTGIVYDPGDQNASNTTTTGLFYASSTLANAIYSFDPDTGSTQSIRVGINPYSLGFNYQTGSLLTINSTSNTASLVDSQNFKTRNTLGITSMSQFAIDVDNLTNINVIVDQNNNRVVFLAMPK